MKLAFRVVDGHVVEYLNPRTFEWSVVSHWTDPTEAVKFFQAQDYAGWESKKLSKSNQKP